MDTTKTLSPTFPMSSLPSSEGAPPAGVPPPAGISLPEQPPPAAGRKKARQPSLFLTQEQAAQRLGHSSIWLRRLAKRHKLYAPTTGPSRRGVPSLYSPEHVQYIFDYMTNTDLTTEDEALRDWVQLRQNRMSDKKRGVLRKDEPAAERKPGRARK